MTNGNVGWMPVFLSWGRRETCTKIKAAGPISWFRLVSEEARRCWQGRSCPIDWCRLLLRSRRSRRCKQVILWNSWYFPSFARTGSNLWWFKACGIESGGEYDGVPVASLDSGSQAWSAPRVVRIWFILSLVVLFVETQLCSLDAFSEGKFWSHSNNYINWCAWFWLQHYYFLSHLVSFSKFQSLSLLCASLHTMYHLFSANWHSVAYFACKTWIERQYLLLHTQRFFISALACDRETGRGWVELKHALRCGRAQALE